MAVPTRCLSCSDLIKVDEIDRGWVMAPDSIDPDQKLYYLCAFCRSQVKLRWNANGTLHSILGPTWRQVLPEPRDPVKAV